MPKTDIAALVDEYALLDADLSERKARHKQLEETFRDLVRKTPAAKPQTLEGRTHVVTLSPRANERSVIVPMHELFQMLPRETFFKVVAVSLGELDKHVALEHREQITSTVQTGTRRVSVTKRFKPAVEKRGKAA